MNDLLPAPAIAEVPTDPEPAAAPEAVEVAAPEPVNDGLTPTVRAMRDELAAHFKGADPGSVTKAMKAMQPISATPKSWESRDLAAKAVKAYRADIGSPAKPVPAKKPAARTAPAKPRRTAVQPVPVPEERPVAQPTAPAVVSAELGPAPDPAVRTAPRRPVRSWPVLLLALPAFVAIWSGWVELGKLCGFGDVHPLPGIADGLKLNTAITLPIGMEAYAAFALYVWLSGRAPAPARQFARWSAIAALALGAAGQVAYHLMAASHVTKAPWQITTLVACLPVAVLGMGAALAHLLHTTEEDR